MTNNRTRTECRQAAERRGWRVSGASSLRSRPKTVGQANAPQGDFRSRARSIPLSAAALRTTPCMRLLPAGPQDGAAAMGFALALAGRFLSQRPASALIISEGFAEQESGALYGPGLVAHGLSLSRLVFVRAPDADFGLLGDRGGSQMRRARQRSLARSGVSRAIASPPRDACCSPREKAKRPRS